MLRRGDVDQRDNAIRDKAADVVVADVDVARLPGDLGGFRKLDSGAVVLKYRGGVRLGEAIGIQEVSEVGCPAAAAGQADILRFHAGEGDARVLCGGRARDRG